MSNRCKPKGTPPNCACGCGQLTKWDGSHNRYAQFVDGHQNIGRPSARKIDKGEPPLCACGCKLPVLTYRYGYGWVQYRNNHTPRQPHSEEAKEKMRQAALLCAARIAEDNSQRVWSEESREKARQAKLAIVDQIAEQMSGESNPNWRGGNAQTYHTRQQKNMTRWQYDKLHDEIRVRDGHSCVVCSMAYNRRKLDVHHIDGDLSNNELKNLVTLCHKHHMQIEFGREKASVLTVIYAYVAGLE